MREIFNIFKNDIKNILSLRIAAIIVGGLMFIPGIYAWLNIDSNWNPYDNTGNLPIAIVNKDQGTEILNTKVNMGENIEESLRENTAMKWIFTDEATAKENLEKSEYYGYIVIPEDFSNRLTTLFDGAEIRKPEFDFYVNHKKNPIAPIIVNKAVGTIQNSINQAFVNTVIYKVANTAEDLEVISKGANTTNDLITKLEDAKSKIGELRAIMKTLDLTADTTSNCLEAVKDLLPTIESITGTTKQGIREMKDAAQSFNNTYQNIESDVSSLIDQAESISKETTDIINQTDSSNVKDSLDRASYNLSKLLVPLQRLNKNLSSINNVTNIEGVKKLQNKVSGQIKSIENIQQIISNANETVDNLDEIKRDISGLNDDVLGIRKQYQDTVKEDVHSAYKNTSDSIGNVTNLMLGLNVSLDKTTEAINHMIKALGNSKELTSNIDIVLANLQEDIDKMIEGIKKAKDSELYYRVVNMLKNSPKEVADFISNPVNSNQIDVYNISSYGSKMAPFYSILACWVGCTLLSAILKNTITETKATRGLKHYQKFFGRFMIFGVIAMIQGLIIGIGDIFLQVQVLNVPLFLFTLMLSSLVFMLIIYSLAMTFGKVGQAVSIVIMVLQVAGSGGTFPIELLPRFFNALQHYMPFYPAMNALRETIGGFYQNSYGLYILGLLLHTIIPLILGLPLSKKTAELRAKVGKDLHKTDVIG